MAKDRPPSYQWYPRDFRAEPAVERMSWEQRGRYQWALDASWITESYGVATVEQWREWMLYSPEEWEIAKPAFAPCFKASRDGRVWTQTRMAQEREAQSERRSRAKNGAAITNHRRALARTAPAPPTVRTAVALASDSAFASDSAIQKTKTRRSAPRQTVSDVEWEAVFHAEFWRDYLPLRQCSKAKALAAWMRIPHGTTEADAQTAYDALCSAFDSSRSEWSGDRRLPSFIPHASTWLNDYRANATLRYAGASPVAKQPVPSLSLLPPSETGS